MRVVVPAMAIADDMARATLIRPFMDTPPVDH
jgi:hypothetical protein